MPTTYQEYYKTKLEGAKLFQDFVVDAAWNLLGLAIVQYASETYQRIVGESRTELASQSSLSLASVPIRIPRLGSVWP